jgi:peptidoglycan/LPS O-acetylase OafA/YrhL
VKLMSQGPLVSAIPFQAGAGYLPGLDGLRAISILLVLLSHLGFEKFVPGGFGVTIFFFVSGFLITRLLVGEQNKRAGAIDLPNFYIRRFLRLMPALLVFVAVATVVATSLGNRPDIIHILAACLYFVNYHDVLVTALGWPVIEMPWGHLWSLAVEEHFYLLFPAALAFLGKTHAGRLRLVVIAISVSLVWRVVAMQGLNFSFDYINQATETRMESILWGCLLAIVMDGASLRPAKLQWLVGWHWVALGLVATLFTIGFRDEFFRATWRYSVQGGALFVLVFNLYALPSARFAIDILEVKPLQFLGRLSYSLYLWHFIIYTLVGELGGSKILTPPLMIVALITSFGVACLSYYFVERPLFALRKRFGGHPVEGLMR